MAQRVVTHLIDDIDGVSDADETVRFGLDGVHFEIDLTDEHATELRTELADYVKAARTVKGTKPRTAPATPSPLRSHRAIEIRQWAKDNGVDVSAHGRISKDVEDQYARAQAAADHAGKSSTKKRPRRSVG